MSIPKEEIRTIEQQEQKEIPKVEERIITILRDNHDKFLSQEEIEKELDKRWFDPFWMTKFLGIFMVIRGARRRIVVEEALSQLLEKGKIKKKYEVYGLK